MYVTVTQLELKSISKIFKFFKHTFAVQNQMKSAPGLLKQQTKAKNPYVYLTLTAWDNKENMMRFRNSGAHLEAMKNIGNMAKKAKSAYWESDELPNWKMADRKIKEKADVHY
jgi:heme-degrading monooxygenase HmoA